MRGRVVAPVLLGLGLSLAMAVRPVRADLVMQTPTQTPPPILATQTNFGPGTASLAGVDPFQIQQFDHTQYDQPGRQAVLLQVVVKVTYQFVNTVTMAFNPTIMSTGTVTCRGSCTSTSTTPTATRRSRTS